MPFLYTLFCFLLLSAPARAADDGFIDGFEDVPLLPGFEILDGGAVVFDTPVGTLATVSLGPVSGADTHSTVPSRVDGETAGEPEPQGKKGVSLPNPLKKYRAALTGLGWQCQTKPAVLACARTDISLVLAYHAASAGRYQIAIRQEPVAAGKAPAIP